MKNHVRSLFAALALFVAVAALAQYMPPSGGGPGGTCNTLGGDVTGTCAASTVVKVNGAAVPASATIAGTNASQQVVSTTAAAATAFLNAFTSLLAGTVPASGGGTTNFLRADGMWTAPSGSPTGAAGGDLSGTYPNPLVFNLSNVSNASLPNAGLVHPATTVNGQTCTLGSTCTVTAAPSGPFTGSYTNPVGALSWINQGTATVNDSSNYEAILVPSATDFIAMRGENIATAPHTYTMAAILTGETYGDQMQGMCISDGTKVIMWAINFYNPSVSYRVTYWSNFTTYSSQQLVSNASIPFPNPLWLQVVDDATNYNFYFSGDGVNFVKFGNEARTAFLTATMIGPCSVDGTGSGRATVMTVLSWNQ